MKIQHIILIGVFVVLAVVANQWAKNTFSTPGQQAAVTFVAPATQPQLIDQSQLQPLPTNAAAQPTFPPAPTQAVPTLLSMPPTPIPPPTNTPHQIVARLNSLNVDGTNRLNYKVYHALDVDDSTGASQCSVHGIPSTQESGHDFRTLPGHWIFLADVAGTSYITISCGFTDGQNLTVTLPVEVVVQPQ